MDVRALILIAIMAIVTIVLRVIPFVIFSKRETPEFITYLGKYLPYSIMAMLVVYCLKDVNVMSGYHGLPEIISVISVAILHVWRRNTLLSIVIGTVLYMVLTQMVFVV